MAPAAKRSRRIEPEKGVLRIYCTNVSNRNWSSRKVEVGGRLWSATVLKTCSGENNSLSVDLTCDDKSAIEVDVEYVILNEDSAKNFSKKKTMTFENGCDVEMAKSFTLKTKSGILHSGINVLWDYKTNNNEGFVKDGQIIVEVHISMKNGAAHAEEFREAINAMDQTAPSIDFSAEIDFENANDPRHDVAIVIGGEKIYAGKQILSVHSPFFAEKFFGEWKDKKEVELDGVHPEDFLELLRQIYSSERGITETNVECLLKLADRFEIKLIFNLAEQNFISSTSEDLVTKLLISDKHKLAKLKAHCFSSLKTVADFKAVKESQLFNDLSDATKLEFFEKWVAK